MRAPFFLLAAALLFPATAQSQTAADSAAVLSVLDSWTRGWAESNAELAVQDYAEDADWTNAFGDRFQGRDALLQGLTYIFSLDFVMSGDSGTNEFENITYHISKTDDRDSYEIVITSSEGNVTNSHRFAGKLKEFLDLKNDDEYTTWVRHSGK